MTDPNRLKRPKLDRSAPRRIWFSGSNDATPRDTPDGVARGVDAGYRVIDEYIRRGEEFAQAFTQQPRSGQSTSGSVQQMTERMLKSAADFTALWFDMMGALGRMEPDREGPPKNSDIPPFHHATGAPRRAEPAPPVAVGAGSICIELSSKQRTRVCVDFRHSAEGQPLLVHALRDPEGEKARLDDVAMAWRDGRPVLRIVVPDEHPAGTYVGVIVNPESGLPQGTISLRIEA